MAGNADRFLNPMLALVSLYKKEGKDFNALLKDIVDRLTDIGIELDAQYVKDRVLPWVLSFLFMTMTQQMLDEYIQNLAKLDNRSTKPSGPPEPPPADLN